MAKMNDEKAFLKMPLAQQKTAVLLDILRLNNRTQRLKDVRTNWFGCALVAGFHLMRPKSQN